MKNMLLFLSLWVQFNTGPLSECSIPDIQNDCRVGDIFFICDDLCGDGVSRLGWFTDTGHTWIIPAFLLNGLDFSQADRDHDGDTDLRDVALIQQGL